MDPSLGEFEIICFSWKNMISTLITAMCLLMDNFMSEQSPNTDITHFSLEAWHCHWTVIIDNNKKILFDTNIKIFPLGTINIFITFGFSLHRFSQSISFLICKKF